MRKKFVEFLKEKGCYEEWVKNIKDVDSESFTEDEFFNEWIPNQPWRFVGAGFVWGMSDQGHDFWMNIEDEWKKEAGGWG